MKNQCSECDKLEGECTCEFPSFIKVSEEKDWLQAETEVKKLKKKDKDVPDVKKKTKGLIGDTYVESILYEGNPCFLTNDDGKVYLQERIQHDGVIYEPLKADEMAYFPYNFDKTYFGLLANNHPTSEQILDNLKDIVDYFIDAPEVDRNLILIDLLLSYSQEWIDTLHFVYFVGETESGKSSGLHLFRWLGYRVLYGEDIPNADIYNFLGLDEEATGTICEDEAQEINRNREKIRTYKNSYSRGATKARILGVDSANKRQVYYKTYCLKLFAGESIPNDKGFGERLAVIYMTEGDPKGNIKRLDNDQKSMLLQIRNKMLYWKVLNYHKGLEKINSNLTKRDQELFEDFLRVAYGTKYYDKALDVVLHFTEQRHKKIWNSLESRLLKMILARLQDDCTVQLEAFWLALTDTANKQEELPGYTDKETFYSNEFGTKITRNSLSKMFDEKFKGFKKIKYVPKEGGGKHQITKYQFDAKILLKLASKYNIQDLPLVLTSGRSGRSGQSDEGLADHLDHVDDLSTQGEDGK